MSGALTAGVWNARARYNCWVQGLTGIQSRAETLLLPL